MPTNMQKKLKDRLTDIESIFGKDHPKYIEAEAFFKELSKFPEKEWGSRNTIESVKAAVFRRVA